MEQLLSQRNILRRIQNSAGLSLGENLEFDQNTFGCRISDKLTLGADGVLIWHCWWPLAARSLDFSNAKQWPQVVFSAAACGNK
jgi:hypothetical protein